jgi:hypothetical protein
VIHGELIGWTRASAGLLVLVVGLLASAPLGAEAVRIVPTLDPFPGFVKSTEIMHARYFSPILGRFLSVDPVGGDVGSSQSWNRYTYVLNNPLVLIDPNGEDHFAILVGDPGLGEHNVGGNFDRVAETRKADLVAAGHTADITRVSTVSDVNTAITSGEAIDGGIVLISHGGVLATPSGDVPAVFVGEGPGAETNLTPANAGQLSNANLGLGATVELAACNSAYVAQAVADSLGRSTTGTAGSMSFSPDPDKPMAPTPGTTPPATGPLYLVPDPNSQLVTREPS